MTTFATHPEAAPVIDNPADALDRHIAQWTQDAAHVAFYESYDVATMSGQSLRPGSGLLRVLHIDECSGVAANRATHLALQEAAGNRYAQSLRRRDVDGRYAHLSYDPEAFNATTTDGIVTTAWNVVRAYGIHRGVIDHIDGRYRPSLEQLHLGLVDQHDSRVVWLRLARATGLGTMDFTTSRGWILDAAESHRERTRVLPSLLQ